MHGSLTAHKKAVNEGVKNDCNYCYYRGTQQSNLIFHMSVHEGVKYYCYHCDYKASWKILLITHMKEEHKEVMHNNNQCDSSFTEQSKLTQIFSHYMMHSIYNKGENVSTTFLSLPLS